MKIELKRLSSAEQIDDVDLYCVSMDERRVDRFNAIVKFIQTDSVIDKESIQNFTVVAKKTKFSNATEIGKVYGKQCSFKDAYRIYGSPYDYLSRLLVIDGLPQSEVYKLFVKIDYQILNQDNNSVSGGERSEFRLLQEINDAHNYDMLLIDEPESSFDNVFLNSNVNQIIREISNAMPVVVVTHNSTVGASIGADYLLFASKTHENGSPIFKLYSGLSYRYKITNS